MPLLTIHSSKTLEPAFLKNITNECCSMLEACGKNPAALRLQVVNDFSGNKPTVEFDGLNLDSRQQGLFKSFAQMVVNGLNGKEVENSVAVESYDTEFWFRRKDTMKNVLNKKPSVEGERSLPGKGLETIPSIRVNLAREITAEEAQQIANKLTDMVDRLNIDNTANGQNTLRVLVKGGMTAARDIVFATFISGGSSELVANFREGIANSLGISSHKIMIRDVNRTQISIGGKMLVEPETNIVNESAKVMGKDGRQVGGTTS